VVLPVELVDQEEVDPELQMVEELRQDHIMEAVVVVEAMVHWVVQVHLPDIQE
jgi:hypothetical protein